MVFLYIWPLHNPIGWICGGWVGKFWPKTQSSVQLIKAANAAPFSNAGVTVLPAAITIERKHMSKTSDLAIDDINYQAAMAEIWADRERDIALGWIERNTGEAFLAIVRAAPKLQTVNA